MSEPCPAFVPLLVRAADDALDADAHLRLDRHVATCAACREALIEQEAAHAALRAAPMARASAGFADRVMTELARPQTWFDVFDFRRLTWRLAPVAAGAAVAAYLAVGSMPSTRAVNTNGSQGDGAPVSAALLSDGVGGADLVSLMLFASPDDDLSNALSETSR